MSKKKRGLKFLIPDIVRSFKRNPSLFNKIKSLEDDCKKFVCDDCKKKIDVIKRRNQNLLAVVSKQKTFCNVCNDKIAEHSSKLFVKGAEKK